MGCDADRFELAQGALAPRRVNQSKRVALVTAASVGVLLMALLTLGLRRESDSLRTETHRLNMLTDEAYASVLNTDQPSGQPRAIVIRGLLRKAQEAGSGQVAGARFDAAQSVNDLLRSWDSTIPVRLNRLSARDGLISLDATVDGEADLLLKTLESVPGWSPGSPGIRRTGAGSRLTLTLTPTAVPINAENRS
ncbi:MAG: hypothetical protein AAGB48_08505 [Planctomycetota bacterium]